MITERRPGRPRGFTLIELLVVIAIIVLITVATLPVVLPAYNQRRVSEGALVLQAALAGARDAAIRANAPRGIRLIPDPPDPAFAGALTASKIIAIEIPPPYSEGLLRAPDSTVAFDASLIPEWGSRLVVVEAKFDASGLPNPPTSWFYNVRQGDKIRIGNASRMYTIAGPISVFTQNGSAFGAVPGTVGTRVVNPERFVNFGLQSTFMTGPLSPNFEFLYLVDGRDNDGDGFVDEGFDGLNNDLDVYPNLGPPPVPRIDPAYNGIDDDNDGFVDDGIQDNTNPRFPPESDVNTTFPPPLLGPGNDYEVEGPLEMPLTANTAYTIYRRPMPSQGAREIPLPTNVVIDLTTLSAGNPNGSERSRLPIDPYTGAVDIMIAPNGQLVQSGANANVAPAFDLPFLHFWITEREDVFPPLVQQNVPYLLPMPADTYGRDPSTGNLITYPHPNDAQRRFLKGERRLVSLNTKTGQTSTTTIEPGLDPGSGTPTGFDIYNLNAPYVRAQQGAKEEP